MLDTLYAIGKELSTDRDPWEDILLNTKADDREGKVKLLNLKLIFDLDQGTLIASTDHLESYSGETESLRSKGAIKIQGGNNKSIYVACLSQKIEQIFKTFFGKPEKKGKDVQKGEFMESIEKETPQLIDSQLYKVLDQSKGLGEQFFELFWNQKNGKLDFGKFKENLKLAANDQVVLAYVVVKSIAHGLDMVNFAALEGYEAFIEAKFFSSSASQGGGALKLCYASGKMETDVVDAEFSTRYNINKFFVKTTQNFANNFNPNFYGKNYQLSEQSKLYLSRGSDYILAPQNSLIVSIAGLSHAVIPRLFKQEKFELGKRLSKLNVTNELIFSPSEIEKLDTYFDLVSETDIYWLSFAAIDSDGNYFKISKQILDVPNFFLLDLIDEFRKVSKTLQPWLGRFALNLYSIFKVIPVRDGLVNQALQLFSQILEKRKIDRKVVFAHFKNLALCHWHESYKKFKNIESPKDPNFDYSIKDGVFRYLGFLKVLQHLDLIQNQTTMEENEKISSADIAEDIQAFFSSMSYSAEQQALFYLGRALSQVAYAQSEKGLNKRVLQKVNFNGMDSRHLGRLGTDLFEKAVQHKDLLDKVQWNLAEFNRRFNPSNWHMNPQEATFYLLSGYTYGIKSKQTNA